MGFNVDFAGLEARLKTRGNAAIEYAANKSAEFFYNQFERAIDFFYASYSPEKYQRHWNMDKAGTRYIRGFKGGMKFGGVKLNSASIPSIYHDDPSYVFYQSTMAGWHGGTGIASAPSPMDVLREALNVAQKNPAAFLK